MLVAKEERVEVDGRLGDDLRRVPGPVVEGLELAVADQRGVVGVVGSEVVVQSVSLGTRDVIEAVEGRVADHVWLAVEANGQP